MMEDGEIERLIVRMRRTGYDTQDCEVKEAVRDIPKTLPETISAFSNLRGGLIILGLSEKNGFKPAAGFDAERTCSALQAAGDKLEPMVRMEVEKVPFEGSVIVVARVPGLSPQEKPCYIRNRGQYEGSFIRSGDGNRHLTPYEVDRLKESRVQPQHDLEPVEKASMADLDPVVVSAVLRRARSLFPRVFGRLSDETILVQLGCAVRVGGVLRPTLAGLLSAGLFPQQYFPRLEVVFTVFPGTSKAGDPATGRRYVDSKEVVGSMPVMLMDTLALVTQRMRTGAVVKGGLRVETPDYPIVAVREAVVNALQHRDYSPEGRGTHVQVNMYSDRLEITNPGGLYGATTIESLGKEGISSTRNEFLSRLLTYAPYEDGFVVENKGTGFMTIEAALDAAQMPPPRVRNSLTFFQITFDQRKENEGGFSGSSGKSLDEAILNAFSKETSLSVKELTVMSGRSRPSISQHLRKLVGEGKIEPLEAPKSPKQRYRLVRKAEEN